MRVHGLKAMNTENPTRTPVNPNQSANDVSQLGLVRSTILCVSCELFHTNNS